jgi:hypothetical protein
MALLLISSVTIMLINCCHTCREERAAPTLENSYNTKV